MSAEKGEVTEVWFTQGKSFHREDIPVATAQEIMQKAEEYRNDGAGSGFRVERKGTIYYAEDVWANMVSDSTFTPDDLN